MTSKRSVLRLAPPNLDGSPGRVLTDLLLALAIPLAVALATPVLGWALLAAVLLSPLVLAWGLLAAGQQARREHPRALH